MVASEEGEWRDGYCTFQLPDPVVVQGEDCICIVAEEEKDYDFTTASKIMLHEWPFSDNEKQQLLLALHCEEGPLHEAASYWDHVGLWA